MAKAIAVRSEPPAGLLPPPVSVNADASAYVVATDRLAFKIGARKAKKEGKSEVGFDFMSIIIGLLTTLLPALLDSCQAEGKRLVQAAKKPSFWDLLRFNTRARIFLNYKAKVSYSVASEIIDSVTDFGRSSDFTEDDANAYLAEGA